MERSEWIKERLCAALTHDDHDDDDDDDDDDGGRASVD